MLMLVTYDVATATPAGRRRLRQVAELCCNYGLRVQNSVFEMQVEPAQWVECRGKLLDLIEPAEDSLRFYCLGKHAKDRIEHHGRSSGIDLDGPLIL